MLSQMLQKATGAADVTTAACATTVTTICSGITKSYCNSRLSKDPLICVLEVVLFHPTTRCLSDYCKDDVNHIIIIA